VVRWMANISARSTGRIHAKVKWPLLRSLVPTLPSFTSSNLRGVAAEFRFIGQVHFGLRHATKSDAGKGNPEVKYGAA
jgi:hypothetical protein